MPILQEIGNILLLCCDNDKMLAFFARTCW